MKLTAVAVVILAFGIALGLALREDAARAGYETNWTGRRGRKK